MNYRRKPERIIDAAHTAICDAEMRVLHSFTEEDKAQALSELADAQDFLRRAVEARDAWDAVEHDEYEEYPDVPSTRQLTLGEIVP